MSRSCCCGSLTPPATDLPPPTRSLPAGINFTMNILKVLPRQPAFLDYVARATDRPAYRRYVAKDNGARQEGDAAGVRGNG